MTIREFIIHTLSWPPYSFGATATQIWHFSKATGRNIKLNSQLNRMVKTGELKLWPEFGPRGGNGYTLKEKR